ncbi:MAG: 30S ribosomal protein S1 [Candidatus Zixiibacteriota bacterium]|nr:MAG: 30S ribosomal protein S1 [candidate division Zixibacteria bacterium]
MPAKKKVAKKTTKKKTRTGGGAKSKTARAKATSRVQATAKKKAAQAKKKAKVKTTTKKTRTKTARIKARKIDVEPVLTAEDIETQEYSSDEYRQMLDMYEQTLKDIREGEIVSGTVMGVTRDDVIVDVGFKSEGIIPISEFAPPVNVQVGEKIEVFLDAIENNDGQLVLSKQKADFLRVWDTIKDSHDAGDSVEGKIVRRIKGGMVVDLFGVDAFLPGSQIALRQIPDFDALIGKNMELKIIKINKSRRNIVVSRRVVLEEQREELREQLLKEIEPGQVRKGIIKNITDFGVFIDLGGVDGLLHITDMSWGRISHPSEIVQLGQEIDVKILDFDKSNNRISLGLKQLTPYPWEKVEEKFPVASKVKGRVVSITDYGAFVELEKGIEGLIHISEMSWTQHIKHPSKLINANDMVEAVVLSIDKENEKISLGLKQLEPDPWETLDMRYPIGTRVSGKVRNLTTFGAFVEIEDGIDGLVHISDMSWTRRIQHPSEVMKKGDTIDISILSIDKENRRISLGHKQVKPDPWPELELQYAVNTETIGILARLLDRGVIVNLPGDIEGFVPANQLGKTDIKKPVEAFSEGDEIPLRVIEFDSNNRRIVLSVNAFFSGKEQEEVEKYLAAHPTKEITVSDMVENVDEIEAVPASGEEKPTEKEMQESSKIPDSDATAETESAESSPAQPQTEPEKPEDDSGIEKPKPDDNNDLSKSETSGDSIEEKSDN